MTPIRRFVVSCSAAGIVIAAVSLILPQAQAGTISYTTSGSIYNQEFDTLPSTGTFTTITGTGPFNLDDSPISASGMTGWSFAKSSGSGANALFVVDDGGASSGKTASYGIAGSGERALGSVGSSTTVSRFGATFVNNTGSTLISFTLTYDGEQWRHGDQTTQNTLSFAYGVGATDINTGTFTNFTGLDFSSPVHADPINATLNGNDAANRTAGITSTVSGLNWANGQSLTIRWNDVNDSGQDDGLAVDHLFFSALAPVGAKTLAWTPANSGNSTSWNAIAANTNWQNGASPDFFSTGDIVQFTGNGLNAPANGAIVVAAGGVSPGSIAISNSSGTYTFSGGSIGGLGALTKSNGGTAILSAANSYSGGTIISGGTLVADGGDNRLGAAAGGISFQGGTLRTTSTGISLSARSINVSAAGGTFDTNGLNSSTTGSTSINGTFNKTGSGDLALNSPTTFAATGSLNIAATGSVTLGQASGTVAMSSGGVFDGNLSIASPVRIDMNTAGQTYGGTGKINILGTALGVGSGSTIIPDGTAPTKAFANTNTVITNTSGSTAGTITSDIVLNPAGTGHVAFVPGSITTATYTTASFLAFIGGTKGPDAVATAVTVNGKITGEGDLFIGNNAKTGGGATDLVLNHANDYQGNTLITTGGTIKIGVSNALPVGTNVVFGTLSGSGNAFLDLNGNNQQVASLSDDAARPTGKFMTITNNGTADSVFTVSGSVTPTGNFGGLITDGATNKVGLSKGGSNTLTLTGSNNYTGPTTVSGGTLALNSTGSIANTSAINVQTGGVFDASAAGGYSLGSVATQTLSGNGTVVGSITVATTGTVSPGNSAGVLTVSGNLDFSGGGHYLWQLSGLSTTGPGTNFDQIADSGDLTLGGSSILDLDFSLLSGVQQPGGGNSFWNSSHSWKIINTNTNSGSSQFNLVNGAAGPGTWGLALGSGPDAGDVFLNYTMTAAPLTGDVNGDHIVNQLDLNVVFGNWLSTGASLAQGDANGDGVINQLDINTITGNWLATGPANGLASQSVPEPTSAVLLLLGAAGFLRRRRTCIAG